MGIAETSSILTNQFFSAEHDRGSHDHINPSLKFHALLTNWGLLQSSNHFYTNIDYAPIIDHTATLSLGFSQHYWKMITQLDMNRIRQLNST
jgi:hypothetical protein